MSMTSGQLESEFDIERACGEVDDDTGEECTFEGIAEAWFDPEKNRYEIGWNCPVCKAEHREATT